MARLKAGDRTGTPIESHPSHEPVDERCGQALNETRLYARNLAVLRAIRTFVGPCNDLSGLPITRKYSRGLEARRSLGVLSERTLPVPRAERMEAWTTSRLPSGYTERAPSKMS